MASPTPAIEPAAVMIREQPRASVSRFEQREMIDVIKQTVCKGATDAQLKVFLEVCKSTGLDPFLKEIWYVAEKGLIMAARDGYLRVANENPQFDGIETRVERDNNKIPIKAVCTVWRKDRNHPTICEAYFNEYNKQSPVWKQYPSAMISKVAEVLALKRSFAIHGVVSEEEIGQEPVAITQPAPQPQPEHVPAGLQSAFRVVDKDPALFGNLCQSLMNQMCEKGGTVLGTEAYDTVADAFYEQHPEGTKDPAIMKGMLRKLWDAMQALPALDVPAAK